MRLARLILVIAVITACALVIVSVAMRTNSAQAELQVQEATAVQKAIDIAHSYGLKRDTRDIQSTPGAFAIKQTTLAEWFDIIDFQPGSDAAKVGLDPNQPVWIVTIKGDVDWVGPGKRGGSADQFDNISVALRLNSLEHMGTFSVGVDQPLPLGLER